MQVRCVSDALCSRSPIRRGDLSRECSQIGRRVTVQQCSALLLPGVLALRQSARSIRFGPAAAAGRRSSGGRRPGTRQYEACPVAGSSNLK